MHCWERESEIYIYIFNLVFFVNFNKRNYYYYYYYYYYYLRKKTPNFVKFQSKTNPSLGSTWRCRAGRWYSHPTPYRSVFPNPPLSHGSATPATSKYSTTALPPQPPPPPLPPTLTTPPPPPQPLPPSPAAFYPISSPCSPSSPSTPSPNSPPMTSPTKPRPGLSGFLGSATPIPSLRRQLRQGWESTRMSSAIAGTMPPCS